MYMVNRTFFVYYSKKRKKAQEHLYLNQILHHFDLKKKNPIIIIYQDFLPIPRRGSHVKPGKTHTQSSRYTP